MLKYTPLVIETPDEDVNEVSLYEGMAIVCSTRLLFILYINVLCGKTSEKVWKVLKVGQAFSQLKIDSFVIFGHEILILRRNFWFLRRNFWF